MVRKHHFFGFGGVLRREGRELLGLVFGEFFGIIGGGTRGWFGWCLWERMLFLYE